MFHYINKNVCKYSIVTLNKHGQTKADAEESAKWWILHTSRSIILHSPPPPCLSPVSVRSVKICFGQSNLCVLNAELYERTGISEYHF